MRGGGQAERPPRGAGAGFAGAGPAGHAGVEQAAVAVRGAAVPDGQQTHPEIAPRAVLTERARRWAVRTGRPVQTVDGCQTSRVITNPSSQLSGLTPDPTSPFAPSPTGAGSGAFVQPGQAPGAWALDNRAAQRRAPRRPAGLWCPAAGSALWCAGGSQHGEQRSELLRAGFASHDANGLRLGGSIAASRVHRGMFPCFLGGRLSRLVRSSRRALMTSRRVSAGAITAST